MGSGRRVCGDADLPFHGGGLRGCRRGGGYGARGDDACSVLCLSGVPHCWNSTNNARSEELAAKATFKDPWKRGQRCIIPAASFDEPNWESGKNQWWQFRRADGDPWGLAGLWSTWTDKATGEVHESYTMLTLNADHHPLMNRMHKPDPKLPPDQQDKRSVIAIERGDVDQWLAGTMDEARQLMRLTPVEVFDAGPIMAPG
ncbi:SOS response-associated peptidase family protein [Variovorax sp. J31P207]|uniref:SOS response-associated peptidase n=1 Tax=Variovorax sp. J31P207 TaxID=3053510 RepID=UPI0033654212